MKWKLFVLSMAVDFRIQSMIVSVKSEDIIISYLSGFRQTLPTQFNTDLITSIIVK